MPNQLRSESTTNAENSNLKYNLYVFLYLLFLAAIVYLAYVNYQNRLAQAKRRFFEKQHIETIIYPSPKQETVIFDKNICEKRMKNEKKLLKQEGKFIREFDTEEGIIWEVQLVFDKNSHIGEQLIFRKNTGLSNKFIIQLNMKDYPFELPTVNIISPEIYWGTVPNKLNSKHPGESITDQLHYFEYLLSKNRVLITPGDKKEF